MYQPDWHDIRVVFTFDVVLTVHRRYYVEMKCQLDATDEFLLQILLLACGLQPANQTHNPQLHTAPTT
jgi:hypothetical protein